MTLSGKKLEIPVKRILTGTPFEQAVNPGTLKNPEALRRCSPPEIQRG